MKLQSYVVGQWHSGHDQGVAMRDATTGDIVAEATSAGIDFAAVLSHAREVGGPALRALTFHERAALLKALAKNSFAPGATSWTISMIAVPSPLPGRPSCPGIVNVSAGRSPDAIDASLKSSLSDNTPTRTPLPSVL